MTFAWRSPIGKREKMRRAKRADFCVSTYIYKLSLQHVVGLKSKGCRKLKRGNTVVLVPIKL